MRQHGSNRLYHGRLKYFLTVIMHGVGIRCADLRHVALPTARHLVLSALPCFFRSRYVRAATLLWISQAKKWFPSLWSFKSKSFVISTWLSKKSALPVVFVDFSCARGELPPTRFGCLHRRAESNFRFVPVAQTQCPFTSRRLSLKKSLSPIMPCASALFNVRNGAFPTSDCM